MTAAEALLAAASKLRERRERLPGIAWWADTSPDYGMCLAFANVLPEDREVGGFSLAFFAYPWDNPDRRTYIGAWDVACYIASMGPPFADALIDLLERLAAENPSEDHPALAVARVLLGGES